MTEKRWRSPNWFFDDSDLEHDSPLQEYPEDEPDDGDDELLSYYEEAGY